MASPSVIKLKKKLIKILSSTTNYNTFKSAKRQLYALENRKETYTREDVVEMMKISYTKAFEEIHHPLFNMDEWIEETVK